MGLINPNNKTTHLKNQFVQTSRALFMFLGVLSLILLLNCCAKKEEEDQISYPLKTAKMISQVSSGIISPDDKIRVRFVAPMVDPNLLGQVLKKSVFSFSPPIDGIASWEDRRTLAFQPSERLPIREKYQGTLDMVTLFPLHRDAELKPLKFMFEVASREISSVEAAFKLKDPNDPCYLFYTGTVIFTEKTDFDAVKEGTSLRMNSKKLILSWKMEDDEKTFIFTSPEIKRGDRKQEFIITIDKKHLGLSGDYKKTSVLLPIEDMEVVEIHKREEGLHPRINVEFSDDMDSTQDIRGLIAVEPTLKLKLRVIGKTVSVDGDFSFGQSYTVKISSGIRSRWGIKSTEDYSELIEFKDLKPQIRFASNGVFLPSVNRQNLRFMTLNLRRVKLEIKRVFDSNLGQFLQTISLDSSKERRQEFYSDYVNRVGVEIVDEILEIGEERNLWLQHELDLKKIIQPGKKGLFLVSLTFKREDMLYGSPEELEEAIKVRYWPDYYSNPYSPGYIYEHGGVYKPVILSDIGLTYKKGYKRHIVYSTHIKDVTPLRGVNVILRTYQNQVIARKKTTRDGQADFQNIEEEVFYIEAEKDGQKSVIFPRKMAWNLSTFDTEGVTSVPEGTRAFIYTERGVYRPGDEINLSVIARNENNTFPTNHPITLKIFNPRGQLVFERTKKDGVDGFYSFKFETNPEDPTGNWRADILIGSQTFHHTLKIETVVPYRLKVRIEPEKKKLSWDDKILKFDVISTYLFGNPASGLEAEVEVALLHALKEYPRFSKFIFSNESIDFEPIRTRIFKGKLDSQGKAHVEWELPSFEKAPSAINASLVAKVLEKGGRPNQGVSVIPIGPYPYYVGIERPEFKYGYALIGTSLHFPIIVVNPEGEPVAARPLNYRIYKNKSYWWWEYETRHEFRLRFKSDRNTELFKEGSLISKDTPVLLDFSPEDRGEYLIEVQDASENGHTAAIFLRAAPWGSGQAGKDAGILTLKSDKKKYYPGDEAIVSFPISKQGEILISVEKAQQIVSSRWYKPDGKKEEMSVKIPITKAMAPTAYVTVSIIQPHSQTVNDRPIRMYGVIPLNVEDSLTRQELQIQMSEELKSDAPFQVKIQSSNKRPTQFTIAVVDEGLLDLTQFETPDPWKSFFKKLRLGVRTFDLFSHIIGVNKGDVFKIFSIGGDIEEEYRKLQVEPKEKKRFKPVSMFKGPLMTDKSGQATVSFNMPNYIGSVRIMVVAARGNSYGHAEKAVPVKKDLMVLPTLPRVLGPEDKIIVPVTVFAMKDNIGSVDVSISIEGPILLLGEGKKTVNFVKAGEQDIQFNLQAEAAIGAAKIVTKATSAKLTSTHETDLEIRPSSPRIFESEEKEILPGKSVSFTVPSKGIPGSNRAQISVRRRPNLNFKHRLSWLIRYPYGCIEQIVSSVFPQLYLKEFLKESKKPKEAEKDIDNNINAGIRRLRRFLLSSGAFTFWPGARRVSIWGTNYAGHFLIEAKKLGYHVPQNLLAKWMRYQKSQALKTRDDLMTRVYRVYLLALAGEPQMGALNLLKENNLKDMSDTERWMLAAAYQMAGVGRTADEILRKAGTKVDDYSEFGGTYGSALRDKAIILDTLVLFERWKEADALANELAQALSSRQWHSTQTTGFMLLAVGKYLRTLEGSMDQPPLVRGTIMLPDGKKVGFETEKISYQLEIESGFGQTVELYLDEKSTVKRAFVTLDWNGVPLKSDIGDESKNLALSVKWFDEDGMRCDPTELTQGHTFWGHFRVKNSAPFLIEELALVQLLPAGWEIENIRLSNETLPDWVPKKRLNREEYLDIRDDRIMWFFDLYRREHLDFVVKLNAVTVGEFTLPPTVVEAMYNNNFKATKAGEKVIVKER